MHETQPGAPQTVALIGNPNTGKSTLFSALVGIHQHVGNYPGVTVEKRTGHMEHEGRQYDLIDLPGLYSLAARSPDERVAVDVLLCRQSDVAPVRAVLCIVDACNLSRHLYLSSQVLELGLPTVIAVNMTDLAARRGIVLDLALLAERLGVPVVATQANRGLGVEELKSALAEALRRGLPAAPLRACGGRACPLCAAGSRPGEGIRTAATETAVRHGWARTVLEGVVTEPARYGLSTTDRIDRWLTHRLWGTAVFALVMIVVFQSVFVWARPLVYAIDAAIGAIAGWVEGGMAEGAFRSLLVDGLIGGVGSVLAFLPQILILFFFLGVLEDCGYMARAAYLMDRLMARVGLSGRSFIPMLSSFACTVPGILAARVIENERDRLATILVSPLLTCSARLPVYALLIAAFLPAETWLGGLLSLQGLTLAALYALGIVAAVGAAWVLKRTVLRGQTPPFLLELPDYHWPSARTVLIRVGGRAWLFLRTAGTLILAISIVVWAAAYYPHDRRAVETLIRQQEDLDRQWEQLDPDSPLRPQLADQIAELRRGIEAAYRRHSFLGQLGRLIEPAVRPLGWDWRIGCAVLASFPAREVVVATLGVVYGAGQDAGQGAGDDDARLSARLRAATWEGTDSPVFTIPVALSLMVFYALCAQCAATLAVIRRETGSWRWPALALAYMTALAYVGAMVTYQVGTWLAG